MKKITIVVCLFWMGFIFYMSGTRGEISHGQSTKVASIIENFQGKVENKTSNQNSKVPQANEKIVTSNQKEENYLDHIIRKNAHGFLYMMLAVIVSSILFNAKKKGKEAVIYILFICLFYAVLDEFHQSFVPGRTSLVSDVLIDFLGSLIGTMFFYLIYYKIYRKIKIKKSVGK